MPNGQTSGWTVVEQVDGTEERGGQYLIDKIQETDFGDIHLSKDGAGPCGLGEK